ncbi:MAG: SUF system NifU family Fe-S cluster assembly protein [Gammaproteobacteria bacterium]|nr:SUF system NifU family Fe-S cluster assembly protein [Gammaproteobacteria bacterium]NIR83077.1 SUF system NifU family Fe-S cluster assembly protein [Gammaproteobacteria bacterium]NIR90739.1 SUF system NifU family Fe-S cluster assembly protein [Gammaproteobacteria bacterium]NIU04230.1 SUF system NifU family Fe-S cluster assembly protein [Gammaproteobacteria bacterium]NIV51522.1 SUF system NifU family Fe-S cluster assembly protein [Gammaproteobacteria bacterium]
MSDLRALYEEVILDHNRNPRNYMKKPHETNRSAHGFNPLCGDEFHVHVQVEDGIIEDIGFEGVGCAISTASASLMTEALKGKTEAEAAALFQDVHDMLTSSADLEESLKRVGKLSILAGVKDFPMRVKCATLAWHTLQAALKNSEQTVSTE